MKGPHVIACARQQRRTKERKARERSARMMRRTAQMVRLCYIGSGER